MRRLAVFSLAFAAAAAVYVYGLAQASAYWIAGACLVLSALLRGLGLRRVGMICLGVCAGLICCMCYRQIWLGPVDRICDTQQVWTVRLLDEPELAGYGVWSDVEIELEGRRYEAILLADESILEAQTGDLVTARMKAKSLGDGGNYLRAGGAVVRLYTRGSVTIQRGMPNWTTRVRLWLRDRLHNLYTGEAAGLLRALLTGDRSELSDMTQNNLSIAGLSHAVAVSGMHVAMLLSMVSFFCGGNSRLTALVGIPMVIFFTLMTGASPSAVRAAIMQTLLLAAPLIRREYDAPTALGAAGLLILLQNPWAIASVSFQLSFAAVAGLLLFAEPIYRRLLHGTKHPGRLLKFAAQTVSASLGATALTLPLTVLYFDMISIVAVVTNLLALWAVTGAYMLGLLSCLVPVLAKPAALLADYVLLLCRAVASFPYAAAYPQNRPLMIWAVCAYAMAYRLLLGKPRKLLHPVGVMTLAFLGCMLWGWWSLQSNFLQVLDVGQGQCLLLNCDGASVVVDCGGTDSTQAGELLARTLYSGGQTRVECLVLTHYDRDHTGGVLHLLSRVSVGTVLLPDMPDESGVRQTIEDAARAAGSRVMVVSSVTELGFSDGKLAIYPPVSGEEDENNGICVLATDEEYDILITGDLDQDMEQRLLARYTLPEVELLVAGHHGAETSTSRLLLDTVKPELVVISVGKENPYGHPAQETLERIAASGAEVRRTDRDGTIVIKKQGGARWPGKPARTQQAD